MGTFLDLHNAVRTRVKTLVATPLALVTQYDNAPSVKSPTNATWLKASIELTGSKQVTIGRGNTRRQDGRLVIEIYSAIQSGTGAALATADSIKDAFRNTTAAGIVYLVPYVTMLGVQEVWYVTQVICPFYLRQSYPVYTSVVPSADVTDFADVASTIRARFKTLVATPNALPTAYDNAPFTPPSNAAWCSWSVLLGQTMRAGLGSSAAHRTPGTAIAMIFVPVEQGDAGALQIVDAADAAFKWVTDKSVTFRTPSVRTVGRAGPWWQINISCPFFSDQVA